MPLDRTSSSGLANEAMKIKWKNNIQMIGTGGWTLECCAAGNDDGIE